MVASLLAVHRCLFSKNDMIFRSHTHTTLLATGLIALALIGACGKAPGPAASVVPPSDHATLSAQVDDAVVTSGVKKALLAEPTIKSFDLQVETQNGIVQLSGFVKDQAQIDKALEITRSVADVISVENGISLKGSASTVATKIDDAAVTARVKAALLADADVKSFDISVLTFKGEVQLTGFVKNKRQIVLATQIAGAAKGASSVKNELMVKQ